MTFADRVADLAPSLSPGSRRIAEHLMGAGPDVVLLSAAELAAEIGTSDASIIRTAKALGYAGLDDLRRAITASAAEPSLEDRLRRSLADGEHGAGMLQSLVTHHVTTLAGVTRRVTPAIFGRAVDALTRAERIAWSATGPSAAVAEYGAVLANRLGRPSTVVRSSGTQLADELLTLQATDAVVLLAYGRSNTRARSVVDRSRQVGASVVLITDTAATELRDQVHTVLACGRGTPGLFSSHGTTVIVIEALVMAMAADDPERAEDSLSLLNDLRASVTGRRRDANLGEVNPPRTWPERHPL
jgi:DNA-binding MurR/RpiR family transcriptional regulator